MAPTPSEASSPVSIPNPANSIIESLTAELRALARDHRERSWRMGEIIHELVQRGRSQKDIAADIGEAPSSVCDWLNTWRSFRIEGDRLSATWTDCNEARKRSGKLPSGKKSKYGTPKQFLRKMLDLRERGEQSDARAVHRMLIRDEQRKARARSAKEAADAPSDLLERCIFGDCPEVLTSGRIAAGSVQVFHFDPPYLGCMKVPGKGYISGQAATNGLRTDCDDRDDAKARELIYGVFRTALPMLKPGGCLLYWANGNVIDDEGVTRVAKEAGWEPIHPTFWNKGPCQPGNFDSMFSASVERLIVWCRAGERTLDHDSAGNREQVLEFPLLEKRAHFPSVTRQRAAEIRTGKANVYDCHQLEKPVPLCTYLLEKTANPGELVVDLCGCSGSFCEAAQGYGCPSGGLSEAAPLNSGLVARALPSWN